MGDHHSWDSFMINEYKIRRCNHMRVCPWAHPGDPAGRRDPSRYVYSPERCPDFWNGCPKGDACSFAHGDYEFWFHPQYYRVHPCIFAPNCPIRICPYFHTNEENRSRLSLNQPAKVPHHNSALQGSSSSVAAYSNQQPRLADHNSVLQGSSSSVACSNQQPRFSYDHDFPELKSRQSSSPSMTKQPNSQTPSRPPPPRPMVQPPNSQTWVTVKREKRPQSSQFGTRPPRPGLGPIARPPRTNIGVQQQQQPQSVLVPFLPTDLSRAFPHLQDDAASLEEDRSKRKHDHEAGSSNN